MPPFKNNKSLGTRMVHSLKTWKWQMFKIEKLTINTVHRWGPTKVIEFLRWVFLRIRMHITCILSQCPGVEKFRAPVLNKEMCTFVGVPFMCVSVCFVFTLAAVPNTPCQPWTRSCATWNRSAARGLLIWRSSSSSSSSCFGRSSTTAKSTRSENTSSRYLFKRTCNCY